MARSPELRKTRSQSPLTRSISVESIAPKLTSFFGKRKRLRDWGSEREDVSSHDSDSDDESSPDPKKRKVEQQKIDEAFQAREKELDEELPQELRKFRPTGYRFNLPPTDRPIRVYADGVFDLFHLGHMRQLEQAKKAFPNAQLVCGVPSDVETHKRKGLTVLTDTQRCDTLKHCKWVDEVVPNAPWCVTPEFVKEHHIDYVAHDDLPYASTDSDDIYKPIKELGMFLATQRTDGISTSDIITKIIKDYDKYLMRNFARGATRKELNVSWLKKNELDFKKHINDFRTYWVKNTANINNVSKDLYFEVREYIRGRKQDSDSAAASDSESEMSFRQSTPMAEFAAKYIGNANKDLNGKSIFANVKGWMSRDHHQESDFESDSTLVTTPKNSVKGRKLKKPVSRKKLTN
ncbi:choline-phosphate cytidylyltransferase [Yamadazyma tenuis]|uniref:choline-phosphate cytidylyltransferase n=1 Tax=Candida tenuis (strain ATCC 10573 / BCRC 21748 / CBS 615 / JCM 9827 / NBRC 10315 / NRRL Y-1498 / VKM Y-70) TaxID=590646 RepID=G3BF73_CANTC|nr:uncharacterized protein CANTEDRAFT_109835 [Yamadazyma tenuis ATCC 10573]EGV60657.1 hypothetical protein CANTEDRAFT_109835 [Yamadazyma tenuis ATCC 10573]WEJ94091.1 choline-phosphate cytidylyltransferase [Yamadazyma tenuis]